MASNPLFDGHTKVFGVDASSDPSENPAAYLSGAINRSFRGGINRGRPAMQTMELSFDSDESKEIFQKGAINGQFAYERWRYGVNSRLIVSVHDRVLAGDISGRQIDFKTIMTGRTPEYLHSWMVQVEDRLYYQNGIQTPMGWNGVSSSYECEQMPIATAMAYTQGRLVVFTDDNYSIISDHIYGNGLVDTRGVEKFTEYQQYNDLGAIAARVQLGPIVGGLPLRQTNTINNQGDLIVFCEKGAFSLDLSGKRSEWLFTGIDRVQMSGRGAISHYSLTAANEDIWYVTKQGEISSFKMERSERSKEWGDTSLSREVQLYMNFTSEDRMQFTSSVRFDNRLLTTCAITMANSELGGRHRFGQGIVSLDFDKGSTTQPKSGFSWDGVWTGINPVQLSVVSTLEGDRCFSCSFDEDGQNRIYEITKSQGPDDFEGKLKSMVSMYVTPYLFEVQSPTEAPYLKTLEGVRGWVSEVYGKASIKVEYRPDFTKKWNELNEFPFFLEKEPPFKLPINRSALQAQFQTGAPGDEAEGENLARIAQQFQIKATITGEMAVNHLIAEASYEKDGDEATDCVGVTFSKVPEGPNEEIFDYKLSK